MCGIVGYSWSADLDLLEKMSQMLSYRGPDDRGYFSNQHINLGHRRLGILDLSNGRQPISNENKTIWTVFNGEIFNYILLKNELLRKGHSFTTHSDTEVIVHAYEEYGINFIQKLNGCFSIALWDGIENHLFLIRDRLGIRPLYYTILNEEIYFASEIKALLVNKNLKKELNHPAISDYLSLRYVPSHETFFKYIKKIPPGAYLIFKNKVITLHQYWTIPVRTENTIKKTEREYFDEFEEILKDSVKIRLMGDVPYGAYLSGGIDSAEIVSLMAQSTYEPVRTFSIGWNATSDELYDAKDIARILKTDHHELFIKKNDYELLPNIVYHLDELIGDPIVIPTYLLSRYASQYVKIILTGEGADEILGGYIHHTISKLLYTYKRIIPKDFRILGNTLFSILPQTFLDSIFPYPSKLGTSGKDKIVTFLSEFNRTEHWHRSLIELFSHKEKGEIFSEEFMYETRKNTSEDPFLKITDFSSLLSFDMQHWLPNYTLLKQDRLTMAHSIEGRVPYLDHRLVEYCFQLPLSLLSYGNHTKHILRKTAEKTLSKKITQRKKRAFFISPDVFDSSYSTFLSDILSKQSIQRRGMFQWNSIEKLLKEKNELLSQKKIFALAVLELWFQKFYD